MNMEKLGQRASSLGGSVPWIPLKDGVNKVRIVAKPGDEEPWREFYKHFLSEYIQVDDFPKAPACLGDPKMCPGCQLSEQIRARGEEINANRSRAQRRFVWAAFSRDNPYDEDGAYRLKVIECPTTVFQGMARVAGEWGIDFTDPELGYDLEILRTKSGNMTKYEVRALTTQEGTSKTVVQSPLTEEERALVADAFPELDEVTRMPDARRFAVALGFAVEEPDVSPGPQGTTPTSTDTPAPTQQGPSPRPASPPSTEEAHCPYFSDGGYDSNDDACRGCNSAEACKQNAKAPERVPQRRSE